MEEYKIKALGARAKSLEKRKDRSKLNNIQLFYCKEMRNYEELFCMKTIQIFGRMLLSYFYSEGDT
jgi:hypothetical protein